MGSTKMGRNKKINRSYLSSSTSTSSSSYNNNNLKQKNNNINSNTSSLLGEAFHCRIEENTILHMSFLISPGPNILPQLTLLHQDVYGNQHVVSHSIDVDGRCLIYHSENNHALSSSNNNNNNNNTNIQNNNNKI